ncbi:lipoyl(octanoyl) transferase LipB [Leucobacter japonicus]|uniref:lipoyl(octanoyl) transferase LipB n=1 Tax=Leucobacter japonicus TaxID=1461259 RepID=UPI0009E22C95|nr:lipoyl(octanoyl) transferase LipB [Leucobacter japonicus]
MSSIAAAPPTPSASPRAVARFGTPPRVDVIGLAPDFVEYADGLRLQAAAAERVTRGADSGTLLLLEHSAVYTAGRRADRDEYPTDGTPVVPVDRGGRVTWHGPGQLVAYPIVRLRPGAGVVDLVRSLETAIIATLDALGVDGYRVKGRSGVWCDATAPADPPAKVAQIGLHARAGVITHGLAINCSNDLAPFTQFVPCGIRDAGVTTISALAGRTVRPAEVAPILHPLVIEAIAELVA